MADPSLEAGIAAVGLPGPTQAQPGQPASTVVGGGQPDLAFTKGTPPKAPDVNLSGSELLPRIDYAVKQIESGNRDDVPDSPKGAIGRSQLMPATAKDLGVDPRDPAQNAEGGRRLLGNLYIQYGNWTDAVAAYNAGSEKVDKWIAAGRPDSGESSLPNETKRYVPAVLSQLGMSPGVSFVASKDGLTDQDGINAIREAHSSEEIPSPKIGQQTGDEDTENTSLAFSLLDMDQAPASLGEEGQKATLAATGGAFAGLRDIIAGPVQAGLEQVAPGAAKGFTDFVNQHVSPFQDQMEQHPGAAFAGQLVGTGIGLLAAGGWISKAVGPLMNGGVGSLLRTLPTSFKATGAGAVLGATSFNRDPDQASRLGQAVLGGIMGYTGAMLGRTLTDGLKSVQTLAEKQQWLQEIKQNLVGLEPSVSGLKSAFAERYQWMTEARNRRYTVRDRAGRPLEGYPTGLEEGGGIAQIVQDAKDGNIGFDKKSANTRTIGGRVDEILGLDKQRITKEQADKALRDYEEANDEWGKSLSGGKGAGRWNIKDFPPDVVEGLIRSGQLPNRPPAPLPFESTPVAPEQMAEARRFIEGAIQRTRDSRAKSQLRIFKQRLDAEASKTAKAAGMDMTKYETAQAAADKFNKEVIAPLQKIAGGRTVKDFVDNSTKAEMYDQVVGLMKGHDREKQEAFAKLLGARGRQQAKLAMLNDMMDHGSQAQGGKGSPEAIGRYLEQHRSGMETVLGRDEYNQLAGSAKVAQEFLREGKSKGWTQFFGDHKWMKSWGAFKLLEGGLHAATGNLAAAGSALSEGVGLIGTAVGLQTLKGAIARIAVTPRLLGVLNRAAGAKPGSPEMRRLIQSIDAAMASQTRTLSRVVPQESGGADIGSVVETGASAVGGIGDALTYSWGR